MTDKRTNLRTPILFAILALNGFLSAWLWWVPIRCVMDGEVFRWANSYGTAHLVGTGISGHFPILLMLSSFLVVITYLGWRGGRPPFHALIIIWSGISFAGTLTSSIQNPESYRFRGDTLGIDISLAWIAPSLWGGLILMTLLLTAIDFRGGWNVDVPNWTSRNRGLLLAVVCLFPLQFILLHYGPQHGTTDKIGLVITIGQWILVNAALMPWRTVDSEGNALPTASRPAT